MKKTIRQWSIRVFLFVLVSFLTIIVALFNPQFLYAHKTEIGNYTILHNAELAPEIKSRLAKVDRIVQQSELYDPDFKINICLNDGALYPNLMETLRGAAFGWGFYNITTYNGKFDFKTNTVKYRGYKWNMEQLIAHEVTHCIQANTLGLLNSNPIADYPIWKWEGYAEFISRKNKEQLSLTQNIERIALARKKKPRAYGVYFNDGTFAPRVLYDDWLLIQYSIDIKGMSYLELLNPDISRSEIEQEMKEWYQQELENKN